MTTETDINPVELATELTVAWLSNPNTRTSSDDVPAFLRSMHDAVRSLSGEQTADTPADTAEQEYAPAVTARKSLANPDFIISMIDGKRYKTLRRHLATNGMTPAEYRTRYNLKADYPMVAVNYSESRRAMAHKIGLGRKAAKPADAVEQAPAKKPRKAKAAPEETSTGA